MALYDLLGNNSNSVVTYQGLINFLRCNGLLAPPLLEFSLQEKIYYVPGTAFADVDNPTEAEVIAWAAVNVSVSDRENGSIISYVLNGTTNNPDWVWVYDQSASAPSTQVLTRLKSPILVEEKEKVFYVPSGAFVDVDNPTDAEVITYALANISQFDRENGSMLAYILNGTTNNPDWIWVYNESAVAPGTQVLTRLKSPMVKVLEEFEFEIPVEAFADPYRPTTAEAEAYAVATYSLGNRRNGVILSYKIPGVTADFSYVWVGDIDGASVGSQVLTLLQEQKTDGTTLFVANRSRDDRATKGDPLRPWGQTIAALVGAVVRRDTMVFYPGNYVFIDAGGAKLSPTIETYYEITTINSANLWRLRHQDFFFMPGTVFWLRNDLQLFYLFSDTLNYASSNNSSSTIGGVLKITSGWNLNEDEGYGLAGMTFLRAQAPKSRWVIESLVLENIPTPFILSEGVISVDFEHIYLYEVGILQLYKNDGIAVNNAAATLVFNVVSENYLRYDDGLTYIPAMIQVSGAGVFSQVTFRVKLRGRFGFGNQPIMHISRSTHLCNYDIDCDFNANPSALPATYITNHYGGAVDFRDSHIVFSDSTHSNCVLNFRFSNLGMFVENTWNKRMVSFHNVTFVESEINIWFKNIHEYTDQPMVYLQNVSLDRTTIRIHFENVDVYEAAVVVCQGLTLSSFSNKVIISGEILNRGAAKPTIKTSHTIHIMDMTILPNDLSATAVEVETDSGTPIDVVIHGTLRTHRLVGDPNVNYVGGTVSRDVVYY